jgi:Zn-dependent proteases
MHQQECCPASLERASNSTTSPSFPSSIIPFLPLRSGQMDPKSIIDGLLLFLGFIVLSTFHEFGHAWMAWKCGDDTARSQGRVSLNPIVHIDLLGTIVFPLLMIFASGVSRFLVGWAKPVPVNLANLRNPRLDDILITLAGPWMNLLLAVVIMALARLGVAVHSDSMVEVCLQVAHLSLLLFFLNLLPIPPLDGSRVVRVLIGMSYDAYFQIARFGFIILIVVLQIPAVRTLLQTLTDQTQAIIAGWFSVPLN